VNQEQYKTWVGGVVSLTQEQLTDLQSRIKILSSTAETNGKSSFGLRVLQAICDVMRKHGTETPSVTTLKKSSAYVSCNGKMADLQTFFEGVSKNKLVQDSILRTAIDLLYTDLLNWKGVAVSSHTLIKQLHRIPSVLNRHFPGYLQSGLLTKLVHNG
jgi:hypothetical protein